MSKVRHYCATFFTEPKKETPECVRYAIYGKEVCPTTQKVHWQAYIEFSKPMRMNAVKKAYNDEKVHLEERKGTRDQARTYCMKDKQYEEVGTWISGQGHRTDLDDIVTQMKNGTKLSDIMLEHPKTYCQYRNGLKDINAEIIKRRTPKFHPVEIILLSGPTRCGKTRLAMSEATYKIQAANMQWWQDYDEDKIICIDEYNNNVSIDVMLALLDDYTQKLNVKGSHTYSAWNKVYITTNLRVHEIHPNAKKSQRDALFARIDKVINYWDEEVQGNTDLDLSSTH